MDFEERYRWQADLSSVTITSGNAIRTGRNGPEPVDGLNRNGWTECVGIRICRANQSADWGNIWRPDLFGGCKDPQEVFREDGER